uniref:Uncharacterized protein n=1 Tax=Pantoea phage Survivor TaxID=3232176 RepID=A0AAU8KXK3_9CAUD
MDISQELNHYSRIISGLESVHEHICYNAGIDVDGTYALEVLKLHAGDMGEVEGTEGFLDSVKKGAKDLAKWIKEIIAAIGRFIVGKGKPPVWKVEWNDIHSEEAFKVLAPLYTRPLNIIIEHIKDDNFEEIRDAVKFLDLDKINDDAVKALDYLNSPKFDSHEMFNKMMAIEKALDKELGKITKGLHDLDTTAHGAGKQARALTVASDAIIKALGLIKNAWRQHTTVMKDVIDITSDRFKREA